MKDLQQNIERMRKELAEMEAKIEESERFEWEYPYGKTPLISSAYINDDCNGNDKVFINHGRYRLSKEYAEHSLERNRVANRLEALVEQIEPDYIVPEIDNNAWFISYSGRQKKYKIYVDTGHRTIGEVYMSKETATKICELLNSGEVVL